MCTYIGHTKPVINYKVKKRGKKCRKRYYICQLQLLLLLLLFLCFLLAFPPASSAFSNFRARCLTLVAFLAAFVSQAIFLDSVFVFLTAFFGFVELVCSFEFDESFLKSFEGGGDERDNVVGCRRVSGSNSSTTVTVASCSSSSYSCVAFSLPLSRSEIPENSSLLPQSSSRS